MMGWGYQEWYLRWTCWAFGWSYSDGRGWDYSVLTIFFGPLRWDFLKGID